jgi:hypothetical protein
MKPRGLRSPLLCGALWLMLAARSQAAPDERTVEVEVVDVAGGRAYISAGADAGLHEGAQVHFGRHNFAVSAISASSAVLELRKQSLKRGDKGRASVSKQTGQGAEQRKRPRELAVFQGQWPAPARPAAGQHPKPVPLGPQTQSGQTRAWLMLRGTGSVPLSHAGSPWGRGELRARVQSEPFHALPLQLDADAALQLWAASGAAYERASASRPVLRVRALQLSYGEQTGLLAAAGRLRYAASTVGQLDGVKLQAPLVEGLRLAAFGGFMPDPLSGKPTLDSARFGGELTWEDLAATLRPRVTASAQATRFDGALDERRLQLSADMFPGRSHIGAYALGSLFDRDNPWNAHAQELSAAGASFEARFGELQLSGRFDMRRPERSRWLASFLPPGWFCTLRASTSQAGQEVCRGNDARYLAQADIGWYRSSVVLNAGASVSRTKYVESEQLAGFANASFLHVLEALHLDAGVFAQTGSLIRSAALSVGAGTLLAHESVDLSLRYRPALARYYVDTGAFIEHSVGANMQWSISHNLSLTLAADAIAGRDVSVLLLQSMLLWRPDAV